MGTVLEAITDAMTMIGALGVGETASTEDAALGLRTLNRMLNSWQAERIGILGLSLATYSLTGAVSYTFGPGKTWNATPRPAKIKSATCVTAAGIVKPIQIVDAQGWQAIPDRTRTGLLVEALWWDGGVPDGNIYVSPKPSAGSVELITYNPITDYATTAASLVLAAGFDRPLIYCLAADLAPAFGKEISQSILGLAMQAKQTISALNAEILGPEANQVPQAPAGAGA